MSFFYVKIDNSGYYLFTDNNAFNKFFLLCVAADYDDVIEYVKSNGKKQQQCVKEKLINYVGNYNFIMTQLAKFSHTQVSSQHDQSPCVVMCNHGSWDDETMGVIGLGTPFTDEDANNILITHNVKDVFNELLNAFEIDCLCDLECVAISIHSVFDEVIKIRSYHR